MPENNNFYESLTNLNKYLRENILRKLSLRLSKRKQGVSSSEENTGQVSKPDEAESPQQETRLSPEQKKYLDSYYQMVFNQQTNPYYKIVYSDVLNIINSRRNKTIEALIRKLDEEKPFKFNSNAEKKIFMPEDVYARVFIKVWVIDKTIKELSYFKTNGTLP